MLPFRSYSIVKRESLKSLQAVCLEQKIVSQKLGLREALIGESGVLVIAEVGINHDGSIEKAAEIVRMAAEAGADCVKFQTFKASDFLGDTGPDYEYFNGQRSVIESQKEMFERLELPYAAFRELFNLARSLGLVPMSTPVSREALRVLQDLDCPALKIGSDDLTNLQLVGEAASTGIPLILSTGLSLPTEVSEAVRVAEAAGCQHLSLLHCVSVYPTPDEITNLGRLGELKIEFPAIEVGFSDHTVGTLASLLAVAKGASIIEKHVTLNKGDEGPDHHFSADLEELTDLVIQIRRAEKMLLSRTELSDKETEMRTLARRSIFLRCEKKAGEILKLEDFVFLRPGSGVPPSEAVNLMGRRLLRDCSPSEPLQFSMVEGI